MNETVQYRKEEPCFVVVSPPQLSFLIVPVCAQMPWTLPPVLHGQSIPRVDQHAYKRQE